MTKQTLSDALLELAHQIEKVDIKGFLIKNVIKPYLEKTVGLLINLIKLISDTDKIVIHIDSPDKTEILEIEFEVLKNSVEKLIELRNEVEIMKEKVNSVSTQEELQSLQASLRDITTPHVELKHVDSEYELDYFKLDL